MPLPGHLPALIRLFGRGGLGPISGPLIQADLASVATALDLQEVQLGELGVELHAQSCSALLSRWEALLRIVPEGDPGLRVAQVVARLTALPDLRPETIEGKVEDWTGLVWSLEEYTPVYFDVATTTFDDTDSVFGGSLYFTITADAADAEAAGLYRSKVEAYLDTIQPAHVESEVRFTGFYFDDEYSLFDGDILGV